MAAETTTVAASVETERHGRELAHARAELQDFIYSVSHDLRAPLRHISAFAQVIAEDLPDPPPDILAHLATLRQAAQLLTLQLDGLAQLARLGQQALTWQAVDVGSLARRVADELVARYPQQSVQWQLAPDVPWVWADAALLRQVLLQVMDNAVKFSRDRVSAHVTLSWQKRSATPPDKPEGAAEAGDLCELRIEDQGIGLSPDQTHALFKVFGRLPGARPFAGVGLGLVAIRKISHARI